ncbi:MAG: site-2 protease family protein [Vicinamibacterales bacterium]
MDLTPILIGFAIVLASLTVHEAAHAWTADRLGDPTARLLGRVSLNPIVHIDPIGTILLPLLAAYSGLPIIGWAKPVPVNISRLRHHRRDFMFVAAAGPLSNIAQAVIFACIVRAAFAPTDTSLIKAVFAFAVEINLLLAFFNLIPIPPLDGGNVLAGLLPESAASVLDSVRQFGFILLYALMLTGVLFNLIRPPTDFLLRLLLL